MPDAAQTHARQYLRNQILNASPLQLVVMLYDAALRHCRAAREHMEARRIEDQHRSLVKAQDIVLELLYSLDRDRSPGVASNLNNLYAFCYMRLVEANIERDPAKIEEVEKVLAPLREAWVALAAAPATEAASAPGTAPAAAPPPESPRGGGFNLRG